MVLLPEGGVFTRLSGTSLYGVYVKALVRWATGKRLPDRLPTLKKALLFEHFFFLFQNFQTGWERLESIGF